MPFIEEDHGKQEVIYGIVYDMSPSVDYRHGIVNGNIYTKIKISLKDSLCLVFMENLDYKYSEAEDYVIPDVMVLCDRRQIKGGTYFGTPRFIVETLSPSTAAKDRTIKKDIYESCGVEEYWIVSPKERAVEVYLLREGKYMLSESYILDDDKDSKYYNAETQITLQAFPITMTLKEIFEGVE